MAQVKADPTDLEALNERFELAHPRETLAWAFENIAPIAIANSFQVEDLILVNFAREAVERVPVLFLQTDFHFPETLEFRDKIVKEWNLELVETKPTLGRERQAKEIHPELFKVDPTQCCNLNKVLPLQNALNELDGWVTGVRRDQAPTRANTPPVERQTLQSEKVIWKLNPLVRWTRADVWAFVEENDIPRHPLYERNYLSIGCAPCTRAVKPGEDERAGRWDGADKVECGIHTFGGTAQEAADKARA